jgi:hypothetical protein
MENGAKSFLEWAGMVAWLNIALVKIRMKLASNRGN